MILTQWFKFQVVGKTLIGEKKKKKKFQVPLMILTQWFKLQVVGITLIGCNSKLKCRREIWLISQDCSCFTSHYKI